MKAKFLLACVCAAVLCGLFASCNKKGGSETIVAVEIDGPRMLPGVILIDWGKYIENDDGAMVRKEGSSPGEIVSVYTIVRENGIIEAEHKTATRRDDKQERDFYHIRTNGIAGSNGADFWVQNYALACDAYPAVVISNDAMVYTKPDLGSPSRDGLKLPLYTIVGVHNSDLPNPMFECVSAYTDKPIIRSYLKAANLSVDSDDLEVLKLYQSAKALTNNGAKREILQNALSLGGRFSNLIQDSLDELEPVKITFTTHALAQKGTGVITSDFGTVNVRDKPGSKGTKVLFSLNDGDEVTVSAYTIETEAIAGYDEAWYQIDTATGKSGWVYGAYLSDY
jgi:hypothetical protein